MLYVWTVDALWPAKTAVLGVYAEPPPSGSGIEGRAIAVGEPGWDDFTATVGLRTAVALTRAKDWIHDHLPL